MNKIEIKHPDKLVNTGAYSAGILRWMVVHQRAGTFEFIYRRSSTWNY